MSTVGGGTRQRWLAGRGMDLDYMPPFPGGSKDGGRLLLLLLLLLLLCQETGGLIHEELRA